MDSARDTLILLIGFGLVALASGRIGQAFARIRLPLITGFLFTGIVAGPFMLGLIPAESIDRLHFVDELSLAFIAFAAGSELYLKDLRDRLRSIAWITAGLVVSTLTLGALAVFLLADWIPFMAPLPPAGRLAVALLAGTILVARSPSAAIAIINELRAKGPFTRTVLGVTVIMDVVVITLFAINSSLAGALLGGLGVDLLVLAGVVLALTLSFLAGLVLERVLVTIMALRLPNRLKTVLILLSGYAFFELSLMARSLSHRYLPFDLFVEPLLVCMLAGFMVINFSSYRAEFSRILQNSGLPVYIAFFTLTGASLNLELLRTTWPIALALFGVRMLGIFLGSFTGGVIAGEPMRHNRIRFLGFITQAGVALGLAREVAVEFPAFGSSFATVIISLVVLNETIGPILFKYSIMRVGEAHTRAVSPEYDGVRDALIFGLERQSFVLARHLQAHEWTVRIVSTHPPDEGFSRQDVAVHVVPNLDLDALRELGAPRADAVVCLMTSDEDNYRICELAYEHFGTETLVVRLNDRANAERFQELGALLVDPSTATVRLLEQFVRSPSAASLLLGMAGRQDIIELEVRDPTLNGVALRNLRLPLDTLILSVRRHGQVLISHGYTQLELGDRVTVVGSHESLEEVMLLLGHEGAAAS